MKMGGNKRVQFFFSCLLISSSKNNLKTSSECNHGIPYCLTNEKWSQLYPVAVWTKNYYLNLLRNSGKNFHSFPLPSLFCLLFFSIVKLLAPNITQWIFMVNHYIDSIKHKHVDRGQNKLSFIICRTVGGCLFHLHAKTQTYSDRKMFCSLLLICLQTSALCQSKFLQAFFSFWLSLVLFRTIQLEWVFKNRAVEFKPQSLINLRAKREAGRNGTGIFFLLLQYWGWLGQCK